MKRKLSFIITLWWVILLAIAGGFLMVTSEKQSTESDAENRMLQGFPEFTPGSVFSAQFMTEFDSFLSDAFFGRDDVISFTSGVLDRFSVLSADERMALETKEMEGALDAEVDMNAAEAGEEEGVQEAFAPDAFAAEPGDSEPEGEDEMGETEDVPDDGEAIEAEILLDAEHSYLWLEQTDGKLKRVYTYDKSRIDDFADDLRYLQTLLPPDGVISFTQVPLASVANRWKNQQKTFKGWGSTVEGMLEESLAGTERINVFSTYDILEPYVTGETPMFYITDHHWTAEGAYKVCAEMLKKQGLPVIPYEEYEYKAIQSTKTNNGKHDIFNVLYPLLQVHSNIVTQVTNEREIPLMAYNLGTYRCYLNNTRKPWRRIVTGANTGRKCLIYCDSFGNAFTPYLLPYYDEIHMVDFRRGAFDKNKAGGSIGQLMQYFGIDDIYIITSIANDLRKDNLVNYLRYYTEQ